MRSVPENLLSTISPDQVKAFLTARGFNQSDGGRQGWSVMSRHHERFIIPNTTNLIGYADIISGIVERFASTTISFDEVLYQIFAPNSELMTHRISSEESAWGTATLGAVMNVVEGYYLAVQENAKYVARGTLASGAAQRGKDYSRSCRLGQTDYGSFILKFILPSGSPVLGPQGEQRTFGYEVSSLLEDTFAFLAREDCTDAVAQQEKPPSLNRKVIESIARIAPTISLGTLSEIHFRHAETLFPEIRPKTKAPVTQMDSLFFDRVETVRQQFSRDERFQREIYKCYITDLHKDSPADPPPTNTARTPADWVPPQRTNKITVELRSGGASRRKLRITLLPTEYSRAVHWHDEETPLRIDATIDKRTSNWSVSELHELVPLPEPDARLF